MSLDSLLRCFNIQFSVLLWLECDVYIWNVFQFSALKRHHKLREIYDARIFQSVLTRCMVRESDPSYKLGIELVNLVVAELFTVEVNQLSDE